MSQSEIGLSAKIAPSRIEWLAVAAVLAVLFAADLWTRDDYPAVWCDDISYSEPGINYATTGHFVTLVWQFQPPNTYPSVNCPLYPLPRLRRWLRLSVFAARYSPAGLSVVARARVWN